MSEKNGTPLVQVASSEQLARVNPWGEVGRKWATFVWNANSERFLPQVVFRFPNGYGASVVPDSYQKELVELAVVTFDDEGGCWDITYGTPITQDVERLDLSELNETLAAIQALPPHSPEVKSLPDVGSSTTL